MNDDDKKSALLGRDSEEQDGMMRVDTGSSSDGFSSSDNTEGGAADTDDNSEKLRSELQSKILEVRSRVQQIKAYAASKGMPEPDIRDEQYLDQDPSTLSEADLRDLEMRMQDIDRDVTSQEANQVQQEAGQAVGMLAALGAIGGAGALAGMLMSDEHKDLSPAALNTPEITNGIEALGVQQQRGRGGVDI